MGIHLARLYDSLTSVSAKTFITYITETVAAPDVVVADVSGTGVFHRHIMP